MTRKIWIVILALGLLVAACGPTVTPTHQPTAQPAATSEIVPTQVPEPVKLTFTDASERDVTLDGPAQKIVSVAPSVTETLFAIGAGAQVVARDTFSDYPAEAQSLPDIGGGYSELNTELILSLAPDLVMAAEITPSEQVQALEDLGLTVFVLPNPADFSGLFDMLTLAGQLTGHEEEAQTLNAGLRARVADVEEKMANVQTRPLVFYELDSSDPNAPWTSGPGTFIDMLITTAGGQNVGGALDGAWAQISLEQLLVQDPDIILLGDFTWGGITPEDVAARTGWDALTAVKEGSVYTFDDNLVSRPGPRLVDGLEKLAQLLHPEMYP